MQNPRPILKEFIKVKMLGRNNILKSHQTPKRNLSSFSQSSEELGPAQPIPGPEQASVFLSGKDQVEPTAEDLKEFKQMMGKSNHH